MDIVGRKIALALDSKWYQSMETHRFLKGAAKTAHPTDLIVAEVVSLGDASGIWVKPDEKFSDFSKSALFIPWQFIVAAVLLGGNDEAKVIGF